MQGSQQSCESGTDDDWLAGKRVSNLLHGEVPRRISDCQHALTLPARGRPPSSIVTSDHGLKRGGFSPA
jgi:hypothetical protein